MLPRSHPIHLLASFRLFEYQPTRFRISRKGVSLMHTKGLAFLILVVMALWAVPALGQVDVASATLKGTITDQHDAVVPDATVTATSIDKGISRSAKTSTEGTYQI